MIFHRAGEGKGEPAIEENLQEKASGTETTEPFIVDNTEDDMTTVTAFGVSRSLILTTVTSHSNYAKSHRSVQRYKPCSGGLGLLSKGGALKCFVFHLN